jgi:dihydrofolate reductase
MWEGEIVMQAILSADLNWGIGYRGELLMRVPEDMKRFRDMTTGKVVVMGRKTLESLPGEKPLKDRINIVLSKTAQYSDDGLVLCRSTEELFRELEKYPPDDIFVIGGEAIYTLLLPYCSKVYVTRFEKEFLADRYFPNLDTMEDWELVEESERHYYKDLSFKYLTYVPRERD